MTSLYRKYRPASFEEVLGQDHITGILTQAVADDSVAHAYLFVGSRGTGKTSTARILADVLGISAKDIYEIDAASHTGVENVRELIEAVDTLPFESPYKIYIIDEVHMLSKAAFNALLKTLEEPPPHALFVLATTEPHKVPDTVTSRCEVHSFRQPSVELLSQIVDRVAHEEGYELEDGVGRSISQMADGSFRDALGLLQKLITHSTNKKITYENVQKYLGVATRADILTLTKALLEKDVSKALEIVQELSHMRHAVNAFVDELLSVLRIILLLQHAPELESDLKIHYGDSLVVECKKLQKTHKDNVTPELLAHILRARTQLGNEAHATLALEIAIVDALHAPL